MYEETDIAIHKDTATDERKVQIFNRAMRELKSGSVRSAAMSFISECRAAGLNLGPIESYIRDADNSKDLIELMTGYTWQPEVVKKYNDNDDNVVLNIIVSDSENTKENTWKTFYNNNKDKLDTFKVSISSPELNVEDVQFSKHSSAYVIYI